MNRKRRVKDLVLTILIWTFSLIGAVFLIWMLISVISKGLPGINPEFLTSEYNLYKGSTGILP